MDSVVSDVVFDENMIPVITVSAKCLLVLFDEKNFGSVPADEPGRH